MKDSSLNRLAQPGTQQKCTIVTITQNNAHAPPTVFSNYANVSNEYMLFQLVLLKEDKLFNSYLSFTSGC